MRTRVMLILLVLGLLAVMVLSLSHKSLNPPLSIRIAAVTNDATVVQFRVLNPTGLFTFLEAVRVEESNVSTFPVTDMKIDGPFPSNFYSTNQTTINVRLTQPLSANKTYRVIAFYRYRGAFEQKLCSWVERVPILVRFLPPSRKVVATNEAFVVKPEGSGTNMEH